MLQKLTFGVKEVKKEEADLPPGEDDQCIDLSPDQGYQLLPKDDAGWKEAQPTYRKWEKQKYDVIQVSKDTGAITSRV